MHALRSEQASRFARRVNCGWPNTSRSMQEFEPAVAKWQQHCDAYVGRDYSVSARIAIRLWCTNMIKNAAQTTESVAITSRQRMIARDRCVTAFSSDGRVAAFRSEARRVGKEGG